MRQRRSGSSPETSFGGRMRSMPAPSSTRQSRAPSWYGPRPRATVAGIAASGVGAGASAVPSLSSVAGAAGCAGAGCAAVGAGVAGGPLGAALVAGAALSVDALAAGAPALSDEGAPASVRSPAGAESCITWSSVCSARGSFAGCDGWLASATATAGAASVMTKARATWRMRFLSGQRCSPRADRSRALGAIRRSSTACYDREVTEIDFARRLREEPARSRNRNFDEMSHPTARRAMRLLRRLDGLERELRAGGMVAIEPLGDDRGYRLTIDFPEVRARRVTFLTVEEDALLVRDEALRARLG